MGNTHSFPIKKTPVILTIIFDFLTAGIYSCAWFLIRARDFNGLSRSKKLGMGIPIFCFVLFFVHILAAFIAGIFAGIGTANGNEALVAVSN